jgi:hypothetical protein
VDYLNKIIGDFETHSADGIRECFINGVNPNQLHRGKPLVYELINMYLRSPNFKECMRVFVEFGLEFEDKALLAVLCDDAQTLETILLDNESAISNKYTFECAFTPLFEASLLHICAEYNHLESAKILVKHGASVNTKAGVDQYGFGAQTPIFHAVNQHRNNSLEILKFLITQNADLHLTLKGLIWGKGYDWETFIPSVNPISYAMMGLLPQFQRSEKDIYETVELLMTNTYNIDYKPINIPNKYLYS